MGALWSSHKDLSRGSLDILSGNSSMIFAHSLTVVRDLESPKLEGKNEILLSFADNAVRFIILARHRGKATSLLWLKLKV